MTRQLSSAEWIQEQGAFVFETGQRMRRSPTQRRRVKSVSTGTNPVTVTVSARPLGPVACDVCECDRFRQQAGGSSSCRACGHGVEFHARRVE
jgi:hypothetical protein